MIYPEKNPKEWSLKYDIIPQVLQCACCLKFHETSVPVLIKGYAGLETPEHGCPRQFNASVYVPTSPEEKSFWAQVI